MQYNFIKDNLSAFSVEEMCECFGLSRSGYYDWLSALRAHCYKPVPKNYSELLAYVTLSKYRDHLPLYRQEKMSAHWGATLSRKTMTDWISIVSQWFEPVYGRMRQNLIGSGYLQADETPVRFMGLKRGSFRNVYGLSSNNPHLRFTQNNTCQFAGKMHQ